MIASLLMSLTLASTAPVDASSITRYTGVARHASDQRVLYRESHYRYGPPGQRRELVLYRCPDGRPFARKTLGGGAAEAPDFELHDARSGYREGVRSVDGRRTVFVHPVDGSATRSAPLPTVATPVIDGGFDAFVRAHWDALAAGHRLKFEFLVPSRLKFMHFRIVRHRDASADAASTLELRLELDRWLAFALPHIDVGYSRATHQLLWFRGLSNLRDMAGDNVTVVLRYPPDQRDVPVSRDDLMVARTARLDGTCRIR